MNRHTIVCAFSQRLTPTEVAELWFRRSRTWASDIHIQHPSFPMPGPDGLYLKAQVEEWFDGYHGRRVGPLRAAYAAEDEALRIARGGGGSNSPSSD